MSELAPIITAVGSCGALLLAIAALWKTYRTTSDSLYRKAVARAEELDVHLSDARGQVEMLSGRVGLLEERISGMEGALRRVTLERDSLREQLHSIYGEVGRGVIGGMRRRSPLPPRSEDTGRWDLPGADDDEATVPLRPPSRAEKDDI